MKDDINVEVIKAGKTGLFCNYIFKAIPLAFDESLSYYECLCGLLNYLKNTIIPTVNNNANAVAELQKLFTKLQEYVNNYFDNLDVQDEINKKLDQMVEDGTLDNILMNYGNIQKVYNTFQDVLNDNLVLNQKIKTLGYYEINDGGGGEYIVTNTLNPNAYTEQVNGLYIELIDKTCNILKCGAKPDNTTDNTDIIQRCLNIYNNVYIPSGTFKTNSLYLKSYQHLFGDGKNSILSAISNSEKGLINIENTNIKTLIENLHLIGNNLNLDGILINRNSQTNIDSNEIFNNLTIESFNKRGINLNSTYIRSSFINNCNISNCGSDGIYIIGTDNFINNTLSYWNKGNGIYIQNGSSNKINNSKCFGNSLNGLLINGSTTQINNVESQDNYQCGILNFQSWGNEYSNIVSSTNGVDSTKGSNYPNVLFDRSFDCYFIGTIINRNTPQAQIMHSKYGLKVINSTNINTNIKMHLLNIGLIPFDNENLNVSNRININNINYNINNIYENMVIGKEGDTPGLSQLFSSTNARANSDGSFKTNFIENSQEMKIGNNSTIDGTSYISVYGEIDMSNNSNKNISLYVNGSNEKPNQSQVSGVITFINSAGGNISSTPEQYGQSGFTINATIPDNTAKIRYTINYKPKILNLNGTYSINNIQVGTY